MNSESKSRNEDVSGNEALRILHMVDQPEIMDEYRKYWGLTIEQAKKEVKTKAAQHMLSFLARNAGFINELAIREADSRKEAAALAERLATTATDGYWRERTRLEQERARLKEQAEALKNREEALKAQEEELKKAEERLTGFETAEGRDRARLRKLEEQARLRTLAAFEDLLDRRVPRTTVQNNSMIIQAAGKILGGVMDGPEPGVRTADGETGRAPEGFFIEDPETGQYPADVLDEDWCHLPGYSLEGFALAEDGKLLAVDVHGNTCRCPPGRYRITGRRPCHVLGL